MVISGEFRIPVGEGANLVRGGEIPDVAMFRKICISKRKNWDPLGGGALGAPTLDPPLVLRLSKGIVCGILGTKLPKCTCI